MGHVPHVYLEGTWDHEELGLSLSQRDHLDRVLKRGPASPISYTNGHGVVGRGIYDGGVVVRGEEHQVPRPSGLIIASAPPSNRDRSRFMVEKLAELGVAELVWLRTVHGNRKPPSLKKSRGWAESALEQSRGGWLMTLADGLVDWDALPTPVVVTDPGGIPSDSVSESSRPQTVVIGPEGGWAKDEIPSDVTHVGLGPTILRVDTAAIVASARLL